MESDMRSFIDRLHSDGVDKWISLPEIAVMGDTSSGKSSLLSALSGIPLPANDKLTTRCPLRLRMEKNNTSRATIGIKWHANSDYQSASSYPLTQLTKEDNPSFFSEGITEQIKKAQAAILERCPKQIAQDIIEVNYYGPEASDLTLIDLPGIVRVAGKDESATLVEDIQLLIHDYLANERCVVLAVVPANVDFHNSGIMADAKKYDTSTSRTIPVITKPDLIDKGAEGSVLELLLGKKMDTFQMGFHMVKCRGQLQLNEGMDLDSGLADEKRFFESTQPWRDEFPKHPELFTVPKLRTKLSNLQVRMIRESIPSILQDISRHMAEAEAEIETLGESITTAYERRTFFTAGISKANKALEAQQAGRWTQGDSGKKTELAKQHEAYEEFGRRILSQRLANVSLIEMDSEVLFTTKSGAEVEGKVVAVSADKDVVHVLPHKRDNTTLALLCDDERKCFANDNILTVEDELYTCYTCSGKDDCAMCSLGAKGGICHLGTVTGGRWKFKRIDVTDVRRSLGWLEQLIKDRRNDDLPCFLSAQLFNSIVADMVQSDWASLCTSLITDAARALEARIQGTFAVNMHPRFPLVGEYVSECIVEAVKECGEAAEAKVAELLCMDTFPYTQNHYLFENINKKRNEHLQRKVLNLIKSMESQETNQTKELHTAVAAVFAANEKKSMTRHVAEEMETILDAYGKVAAKRIIDQVPMLAQELTREILRMLEKRLGNVTDELLQSIIRDRPEFVQQHQRAMQKLQAMRMAHTAVKNMRAF